MPWFRFIEEAKHTLRFHDGAVELNFANLGEARRKRSCAPRSGAATGPRFGQFLKRRPQPL